MVSKETTELLKRLDEIEETLQLESLIRNKRTSEWIVLMENNYTLLGLPSQQQDKEEAC